MSWEELPEEESAFRFFCMTFKPDSFEGVTSDDVITDAEWIRRGFAMPEHPGGPLHRFLKRILDGRLTNSQLDELWHSQAPVYAIGGLEGVRPFLQCVVDIIEGRR